MALKRTSIVFVRLYFWKWTNYKIGKNGFFLYLEGLLFCLLKLKHCRKMHYCISLSV